MPFAELAFATFAGTFAEIEVHNAFTELTIVRGTFVLGLVRGVIPGVMVGFLLLDAATNNPGVTDGTICVPDFPS